MATRPKSNLFPLPSGWDCRVTQDGRLFFIDERNRRTTWVHPVSGEPILTGLNSLQGLPTGWEVDTTNDGILYYIDHNNEVTSFQPPPYTPHPTSPGAYSWTGNATAPDSPVSPSSPQSPSTPGGGRGGKEEHFKRAHAKQRSFKAPSAKRNPEATVVKKGWLFKLESSGLTKAWKRRWCILADFALFIYKEENEETTLGSILLPSYRINPCTEADPIKRNFVFKVEHENTKTLYFATDDSPEFLSWLSLLRQAAIMNGTSGFQREPNSNYPSQPGMKSSPWLPTSDQGDPYHHNGQANSPYGQGHLEGQHFQDQGHPSDPQKRTTQPGQSSTYRGYGDPSSSSQVPPSEHTHPQDSRGYNPYHRQTTPSSQPMQRHSHASDSNRNSLSGGSNRGSQPFDGQGYNQYFSPESQNPHSRGRDSWSNGTPQGYHHDQLNSSGYSQGDPYQQRKQQYPQHQYPQQQQQQQQPNLYLKDGFAPDSARNSLAHSDSSGRFRNSYNLGQAERDRLRQQLAYRTPDHTSRAQQRDSYSDYQEGQQVRQLSPWDQNFPAGPVDNPKHASFHNLLLDNSREHHRPIPHNQVTFNARSKSHENFSKFPSDSRQREHQQPLMAANRSQDRHSDVFPQHPGARDSYSKENQSPLSSQSPGQPVSRDSSLRQPGSTPHLQRSRDVAPIRDSSFRDSRGGSLDPRATQELGQGQHPQLLMQDRRSYASNASSAGFQGSPGMHQISPAMHHQNGSPGMYHQEGILSMYQSQVRGVVDPYIPVEERVHALVDRHTSQPPSMDTSYPDSRGDGYHHRDPRSQAPSHHLMEPDYRHQAYQRGPPSEMSSPGSMAHQTSHHHPQDVNRSGLHLDLNTSHPEASPHTYVNFPERRVAAGGDVNLSQDRSPGRPPYPSAVRDQIVEELAQTHTPVTQRDFLTSTQLNKQRMEQPEYFQYPSPRDQPNGSHRHSFRGAGDGHPPAAPHNQSGSHLSTTTASRTSLASRGGGGDHQDSPHSPHQDSFTRDMSDPEAQKLRVAYERVHSLRMTPDKAPPKRKPAPIQTVKEDPNMSDREVLETNLQKIAKKNPLSGPRLRMSISAGDLIGKTHDELVLLLIQLRRNQAALENTRDFYRSQIERSRGAEQEYRRLMHQYGEVRDRPLQEIHQTFLEGRGQMEEIENKLEVYRPIINLLDNMVTMGSLYGGDNLMLATQYRKHLLRPDQYHPPKKMLEFSRRHQEDKLIQETEEEIRQLTSEEVFLEEKIERLNELDRLLQEQSFKVSSFKQDKELMERALSDMQRQQDHSLGDPREMAWLAQQQRNLERELSRVTQQLAEASKVLEETTAENNKLEHEVALLRSKVNGELSRSRSAPSLASENMRTKAKMERELSKVEDIMSGLSKEGQRLSQAMRTIRRSSSGSQLASAGLEDEAGSPSGTNEGSPGVSGGTYLQTDLDSGDQVDLAARPVISHQRQNASAPEDWDMDGADENTRRFFGLQPRDKPKGQTVRDVKRLSEQRKERDKFRKDSEDLGEEIKLTVSNVDNEVSSIIHARIPSSSSISSGVGPAESRHPLYENLPRYGSVPGILAPETQSASSSRRSSLILLAPKPFTPYQDKSSTRPARSELFLNSNNSTDRPFDAAVNGDTSSSDTQGRLYRSQEALRHPDSSPSFNNNKGETEPSDNSGSYPGRPEHHSGLKEQSTFNRGQSGQFYAKPFTPHHQQKASIHSEIVPASAQGHMAYTRPSESPSGVPISPRGEGLRNAKGRYPTISSSEPLRHEANALMHPTLHNTAGDLIVNRTIDDVPDIVKSSQTRVDQIDGDTIDREILFVPDKVLIPERYDAEADAEHLTEAEKMAREEKAERIKRILTSQSVLSMSQPDISQVAGPDAVHTRALQEKKERAHILALSHELAKQVTLKSKKQAAERRKTWSGAQFADVKRQYEQQQQQQQQQQQDEEWASSSSPLRSPDGERRRAEITLKAL